MQRTEYPPTDHAVLICGFAVILHASEYLDLITRHAALNHGDYGTYLVDLHDRMSAARRAGKQVLIGPFLTDQYESYAEAIGESAESTRTMRTYGNFAARVGLHTQVWAGEPISRVVVNLREATDTRADQAAILPLLKRAADLHPDPQHAAQEALGTAAEIVSPLLEGTEPGHHTLTCTLRLREDRVSYVLQIVRTTELIAFPDGGPEQLLCATIATAQLAGRPATLILRSRRLAAQPEDGREPNGSPDHPDPLTIRAWGLSAGCAIPLTAPQAFDVACTDPVSGHHIPPEPGAEYADAFALTNQPP